MSSWFHLTHRRTKDNRPKVYGIMCKSKKNNNLNKRATLIVDNKITIHIFEGKLKNSSKFENFVYLLNVHKDVERL